MCKFFLHFWFLTFGPWPFAFFIRNKVKDAKNPGRLCERINGTDGPLRAEIHPEIRKFLKNPKMVNSATMLAFLGRIHRSLYEIERFIGIHVPTSLYWRSIRRRRRKDLTRWKSNGRQDGARVTLHIGYLYRLRGHCAAGLWTRSTAMLGQSSSSSRGNTRQRKPPGYQTGHADLTPWSRACQASLRRPERDRTLQCLVSLLRCSFESSLGTETFVRRVESIPPWGRYLDIVRVAKSSKTSGAMSLAFGYFRIQERDVPLMSHCSPTRPQDLPEFVYAT